MRAIAILFWVIAGLYLGIGSWVRVAYEDRETAVTSASKAAIAEGIPFDSAEAAALRLEEEKARQWFPFIFSLPRFAALAVAGVAFGLLGGTGRVLKLRVVDGANLNAAHCLATPILGMLFGLFVLIAAFALPAALMLSPDVKLHPITIVVLCFLGGCFPSELYERLGNFLAKKEK